MRTRACLVTTFRNAQGVLDTFISYHLSIGFDHLFLFLDDPEEDVATHRYSEEKVTFIRNDDALKTRWKSTPVYNQYEEFILSEVMARQILNASVAIQLALEAHYDWILHIDMDELFMLQGYDNVSLHFEALDQQGVEVSQYINHEGVPESYEIGNYFEEVTLFKRNMQDLNETQKAVLFSILDSPKSHFRFYTRGKAAAKLHAGLLLSGVHSFAGKLTTHVATPTSILHYPCCGFNHFWSKYKILGNFAEKWFNEEDIAKRLPTHALSKAIVQTENPELAKNFYKIIFMQQGNNQLEKLLDKDIYFRINPVRIQLQQVDAHIQAIL